MVSAFHSQKLLLNVIEAIAYDYGKSFWHLRGRRVCFPPKVQDASAYFVLSMETVEY
jgi:hypothetical protein